MHPSTATLLFSFAIHDDSIIFGHTPQKIFCGI